MPSIKKQHDQDLTFLNEKGDLDYAKLLETKPDLLAPFMHRREDEEGDGEASHTSMSFAIGDAARREALGLSKSYAPLQSKDQIQQMALSAQANLGLEANQGLSMEMGGGGTFSSAYNSNDQAETDKKDQKRKEAENK